MNPRVHTYTGISNDISIEVIPEYIPERSNPSVSYYFYAYTVKIVNNGKKTCQLLNRHWIIRDGNGREEHIQGEGVVGVRPVLTPGKNFQYTSFCPLRTPTGNMRGFYEMVDLEHNKFKVTIPVFFLRPPHTFH